MDDCGLRVNFSERNRRNYRNLLARLCIYRSVRTRASFRLKPSLLNHVGRLLGDHDDRRVGVGADQRGHYGRVDHPEPFHAVHSELRVDHGRLVPPGTHLGRADRVIYGHGVVSHHALPVGVRVLWHGHAPRERYVVQTAAVPVERRGPRHGHHELDALHQRVDVLLFRQVVGHDLRIFERVGAPQQYFASTFRPQQHL